ncbi:hypothetical protein EQ828_18870 [Ectopseudomonas mendocina]|nr:hypothetical protein [Pseudomonas mendocina]TRO17995.1 hypothetical protein EQ828_18870 [Pseudomonas mendocina]
MSDTTQIEHFTTTSVTAKPASREPTPPTKKYAVLIKPSLLAFAITQTSSPGKQKPQASDSPSRHHPEKHHYAVRHGLGLKKRRFLMFICDKVALNRATGFFRFLRQNEKPDRKMPWSPRICCFRSFSGHRKKAGKSGQWLQKPENPPENPKNLTGKCPGTLVFTVSGHFPVSEKGRKIRAVAAETGKSTGKPQKPDRKMPCSPRIYCFRSFSGLRKRPENPGSGCRNRKIHRKIPKT